jgi:hypothetical protein
MLALTEKRLRARIVSYWLWGINHEPQIHYAQQRPMENVRNPSKLKTLPRTADCSEFVTDGYASAGAPDPNGRGFDGQGYTGTLLTHGTKIRQSALQPGDLVVFGKYPGEHVCGVLESGSDPLLASHGQERGPVAIRLSVEKTYHSGQAVIFLRALPKSAPKPKPKKAKPKFAYAVYSDVNGKQIRVFKGSWAKAIIYLGLAKSKGPAGRVDIRKEPK